MRKGRVIKDFLHYKKGEIIDIYSFEDLEQKEKQLLLVKNCLNFCRLCVQIYKDNILGFILYEVKDNRQDYLFLSKKNEDVELLEEKNDFFIKSELKTGDVLILKNGTHLMFINRQIGFVNIHTRKESSQELCKEFRYIAFREDMSHFRDNEDCEVVKIYRFKSDVLISQQVWQVLHKADLIFEKKKVVYYTLKEASELKKKFRHKGCKFYSNDAKEVLDDAFRTTGKDLFYLIEAKEYEVEE